jgi:hypothetical protein
MDYCALGEVDVPAKLKLVNNKTIIIPHPCILSIFLSLKIFLRIYSNQSSSIMNSFIPLIGDYLYSSLLVAIQQ